MKLFATQFEAQEWAYQAGNLYADPFNEIELDVVLTHESGKSWRMPAYWAGGQEWRVRFAPPLTGTYQVTTECNPAGDPGLHAQGASLQVQAYQGSHPTLPHGPLRASANGRTLEYSDGKPFFWLADTWWMGLCARLDWPVGFKRLAAERKAKGFSVVQIVAGLYPDMPGFDPRGANEAGFPWEADYSTINPAYFDMADLRIRWLVKEGLTPCIVSGWGYYLPIMGTQKIKQHWRYLVARWGAYPVIWCLAGEVLMPYYLSEDKEGDVKIQEKGWTEVGSYIKDIDPYQRLLTIHDHLLPGSRQDLNMLQTGHDGYRSLPNTVTRVREEYARKPNMPVLVGEANYEGIMNGNEDAVQRLTFWASILSGACGHTYGANGLWQLNGVNKPYGASPWGGTWGGFDWEGASQQAGSAQLALGKRLLERYEWWRFEPRQDWIDPAGGPDNPDKPFAAGIPGEVRIIYFYWPTFQIPSPQHRVCKLEAGVPYRAFFWNPRNGQEFDLGDVAPDAAGSWSIPIQPELKDWVVVLERKHG